MQTRPISTFGTKTRSLRATSTGQVADQRSSIRYAISLAAEFCWTDPAGNSRKATGYTRDLSSRGAFLRAIACPGLGATVRISFQFSPGMPDSRPVQLYADGLVLRIEQENNRPESRGFAVVMRRTKVQTR